MVGLARIRVTIGYAVTLLVVSTLMARLEPDAADRVIQHASTNLHNLAHGRLGTLLASAFVVDAGPPYLWLPGLVCLLALGELIWGGWRLIVLFGIGHVGATLVVAAGLVAAVGFDVVPVAVARDEDVGMSYGAAAVLGALTPVIPRRWQPVWMGWWLAASVVVVVVERDFTDVGHALALTLGLMVSAGLRRDGFWSWPRAVLAVAAVSFGFLVIANDSDVVRVAAQAGLVGASCGAALAFVSKWLLVQWNSSAEASIQSERHDSGGPRGVRRA